MKLAKTMFAVMLSAIVAKSDTIGLQLRPDPNLQKKYITVPAGKVCKIITMTENVGFGFVDATGFETVVHNAGKGYIISSENIITVAGPAKLFFKKESTYGGLVTLDVVDQSTPKSGVTFTAN